MVKFWHKSHTASSNMSRSIYKDLGKNIRKLRKENNMTQEQLADKAKMDPKSVIEIEAGRRNPTLKTIKKISHALKAPARDLLN